MAAPMQIDGSATEQDFRDFHRIFLIIYSAAIWCSSDTLAIFRLMSALPQAFDDGVEHRHEEQRQDRRGEHAAEHGGADRLPARRACAGRDHQRHDAEDEGEGRHQDRPQPQPRGFHRGVDDARAPPRAGAWRTRRSESRSSPQGRSA